MTTIEFSTPGSGEPPVTVTSDQLSSLAKGWRSESHRVEFRVYGLEFCRMLGAVALFQASPKDFASYAAVRCLSRHDGLSMAALNGGAAAAGHVQTEQVEGYGAFSIPHAQVKAILSVFKVALPKEVSAQEYVLLVEVSDRQMTITDVSGLIDGSSLTVDVAEDPLALERGEKSSLDLVHLTFQTVQRGLDPAPPLNMADGIWFSPAQVGRIARAATLLGLELHMQMNGRMLLAPLDDDFMAYCASAEHREDDDHRPPWIDARSLGSWRGRLREVIDEGVI
ncbi:hypothetical protein ACTXJ9_10935 [Brachybacterium tyrofermentans]|uniref:hypothetical protein n=1 Tax=Brachybacterium tyrofermentans TaxID=47848 RepID=UPI003F933CE3